VERDKPKKSESVGQTLLQLKKKLNSFHQKNNNNNNKKRSKHNMSPKLGSHNKVLSAARNESTTETIPLLPATGWQKFLSGTNPKGFS
jgi:hypothetical protein